MSRFDMARNTNIAQVAEALGLHLHESGNCLVGSCPHPGCAANDGFVVFPDKNRYWCRRSAGAHDHATGTTIDLVCLVRNCDKIEAVNWLLGPFSPQPATEEPRPQQSATDKAAALAQMAQKLNKRNGALLEASYSHEKRLWLAGRGLDENTWKCWLLGDAGHGVALPWLDRDGAVVAVNTRRLSPEAKARRYFWEKGIFPHEHCYGAHLISHDRAGVIVVEGEFNSQALWQHAGDRYNVVSPGSSSAKLSPAWAGWIAQHERIAVWADDLRTVDRWAGAIGREVVKIVSPVKSGVKYDANECLMRGILGAALAKLGL